MNTIDEKLRKQLEVAIRSAHISEEVLESRFGRMPVGNHLVTVRAIMPFMASLNCKLADDCTIGEITEKPDDKFDKRFNQAIVVVVFQNEVGNAIINRRSMKGWLTDTTKDNKTKQIVATPEFIREHKLKAVPNTEGTGYRFIDEKGKGFPSVDKTASCMRYNNLLCQAVGLPAGSNILDVQVGDQLWIKVEQKNAYASKDTGEMVDRFDVTDFAHKDKGFPTEPKSTKAVAEQATPIATEAPDDLPF